MTKLLLFFALKQRLRAAGLHLLASALVAALASLLVFTLWYPPPFSILAGGTHLFLLLVSVDVVMGPLLTFIAASGKKTRSELARDLAAIVTLQLAAFGYGLYTMALARPVAIAFEVDLMRVVSAADVDAAELAQAPLGLRELSWTGPRLIAAVKPLDAMEQMRTIELGLSGIQLSMMPRYWRDYASQRDAAWSAARPLEQVVSRYPQMRMPAAEIAEKAGRSIQALRFLPLVSRQANWIVVVSEPGATVAGYLPVDGF